jgi:hypothetical protein
MGTYFDGVAVKQVIDFMDHILLKGRLIRIFEHHPIV